MRASLRLDFELDQRAGRTVLRSSEQQPPLRVVRAFPLEDGAALAHLHNVSGGVLGGDELHLAVHVGAGAAVQLTTTGATRIYRAQEQAAVLVNEVAVGENGILEYVPDAIIPFAEAHLRQRTAIHLAEGAGLFWWEILAPGREARGETFAYDCVELKTEIKVPGRWIAAESVRLEPGKRELQSLERLGRYRHWATFYVCRVGVDQRTWLAAEQHLREVASGLDSQKETLWGVSTLSQHGLVVRCLALQGRDALSGLRSMWRAAKLLLYGREAILPRKIN